MLMNELVQNVKHVVRFSVWQAARVEEFQGTYGTDNNKYLFVSVSQNLVISTTVVEFLFLSSPKLNSHLWLFNMPVHQHCMSSIWVGMWDCKYWNVCFVMCSACLCTSKEYLAWPSISVCLSVCLSTVFLLVTRQPWWPKVTVGAHSYNNVN